MAVAFGAGAVGLPCRRVAETGKVFALAPAAIAIAHSSRVHTTARAILSKPAAQQRARQHRCARYQAAVVLFSSCSRPSELQTMM